MILTLSFVVAVVASVYGVQKTPCDTIGVRPFARINNNFGKELLDVLSKQKGNVFFSPSSLSSLLSAVYHGAKGQTATQLVDLGYLSIQYENATSISPHLSYCLEILKMLRSTSDEYTLERANAILVQKGSSVLEEYEKALFSMFGALTKEVDFIGHKQETIEEVNEWVKEKTHGKIQKLVSGLDAGTSLLMLSAIYFKGTWQTEFDPENTEPRPFYNNGNAPPKSVPTMKLHTELPFLYDSENQYRAVQLPYKGDDVSMLILLPFERNGIERLQKTITYDTIIDVLERLRQTEVTVYLPKFQVQYSKNMKDDLSAIGLGALFSADADFSGITGSKDVKVSDIVHKAVIEVNEEGSEAAAVSGGIIFISRPIQKLENEFKVDHPFIFFIVDNRSYSNLFVGRVNEL